MRKKELERKNMELEQDNINLQIELKTQKRELKKAEPKLIEPKKYVEFGVMVVESPLGLSKEKTDELLKPVQERMNEQMELIGVDMKVIVMQGAVKSFDTYMVDAKKEE